MKQSFGFRKRAFFLLVAACAAIALSCDERLPPRNDPSKLFSADLSVSWSLSSAENEIKLRLILTNTYDEVIEGAQSIEGTISISLARDPSYTREYSLSEFQIDTAPFYNPTTGHLRVPPGESVTFFQRFDWLDGRGRDVRAAMNYVPDPTCAGRFIARRETFIIHGEAALFPRISAAVATPVMFELCHADVWVNPRACPPVTGPTAACID